MELNNAMEFLKDKEYAENFFKQFPEESIVVYSQFHNFLKQQKIVFEIQQYHDFFIIPLNFSEGENFVKLYNSYFDEYPEKHSSFIDLVNQVVNLFSKNLAELEGSNLNENEKGAAYNLIAKNLKNTVVSLGISVQTNDTLKKLMINIDEQVSSHQTPSNKFVPKYEIYFFEDMLSKMAQNGLIGKEFNDAKIRLDWIKNAFYFGIKEDSSTKYSLYTLNWCRNKTLFGKWLMFIYFELIYYDFENKGEFYKWICTHFKIKDQTITNGSIDLETLKAYFKNKNKGIDHTLNFKISNDQTFTYGQFYPPKKNF